MLKILSGDCLERLTELGDETVDCCVTSPPYWGLRDYGVEGQLGLEKTPEDYVSKMVSVFREVRRVLRKDGTLWLNLGDSYSGSGKVPAGNLGANHNERHLEHKHSAIVPFGLKPKDLVGIPWMVAFALRADGWYLRQDIIWHKPNPMPESVTDRCTKAHEYIFLLSKSARYYYDAETIQEPFAESSIVRLEQPNIDNQLGSERVPGKTNGTMKACGPSSYRGSAFTQGKTGSIKPNVGKGERVEANGRNKRSVWTVTTKPYSEAHFATFPPDLIKPCVLAGCPIGGIVLDPFGGSGTTGMVALELGRSAILIELNPEYVKLIEQRTDITPGLKLT